MKFIIEVDLKDGKANAPGIEVAVNNVDDLLNHIYEELLSDEGEIIPAMAQMKITRIN